MQSGITDLNMSKVAIRSSSGPTFDPVTSSGAVRGWRGEEYERQRKYWTFRGDLTGGTGGGPARGAPPPSSKSLTRGAALNPLRSIKGGRAEVGKGFERGDLMKGGGGGIGSVSGRREPIVSWRGMLLNAEEIWNSPLVGTFKVRRSECFFLLFFFCCAFRREWRGRVLEPCTSVGREKDEYCVWCCYSRRTFDTVALLPSSFSGHDLTWDQKSLFTYFPSLQPPLPPRPPNSYSLSKKFSLQSSSAHKSLSSVSPSNRSGGRTR
jgi:hypothetical protein